MGLDVPVYADLELQGATDYVTGANAADAHFRHVDLRRDAAITAWADLRAITPEDVCPRCGGRIELTKGIEVGHIFMLGLKYSESMHAAFLDENGKEKLMIMGCYGIGVSRVAAAAIEQNHDENGIVFPPPVAPFECILLNLDPRNAEVTAKPRRSTPCCGIWAWTCCWTTGRTAGRQIQGCGPPGRAHAARGGRQGARARHCGMQGPPQRRKRRTFRGRH